VELISVLAGRFVAVATENICCCCCRTDKTIAVASLSHRAKLPGGRPMSRFTREARSNLQDIRFNKCHPKAKGNRKVKVAIN